MRWGKWKTEMGDCRSDPGIDLGERAGQNQGMRFSLCAVTLLFLGFSCDSALAQGILPGDRWPVRGVPVICGREIPEFVLFFRKSDRAADKNHPSVRASLSNLFIPVSQTKEGVFYHAVDGVWERSYDYGKQWVPGGLYVSKTKPNAIFIYFGDARKPGWDLRPMLSPLPMKEQERLRIGTPKK
jgi:hypothetical protein